MKNIQPCIRSSQQRGTTDWTITEGQHEVPPSPDKDNPIQVAQDSYSSRKFGENEWRRSVEVYSDSL